MTRCRVRKARSSPKADILFSRLAVIAPYGDGLSFQFRIANTRRNEIIELEAQVLYSAMEPDGRGGVVRKYSRLALERNKVVFCRDYTLGGPANGTAC